MVKPTKMSTFGGRIKELENVLVDNFLSFESHTCFFLSHCHLDHMNGLDQLFSSMKDGSKYHIYCSPISRLILLNKFKFVCENLIKEITSAEVITVPENDVAPSYQMTVTPVPAGHCPGSVMFLFETLKKTILYTGDFRIVKNDFRRFKPFHCGNQIKIFDKIYFDSTFLNEMYWNFPLRSEVVDELLNIIKNWISKSSAHNVLLETSAWYGYEYIFVELARKLKCKIHVKDLLHDLFWNVPEIGIFLTKHCTSTRLHAVGNFDKKCFSYNDENLLRIKLSAQWYKCSKEKFSNAPFWKEISCKTILMCYSTHSSCSELLDFLNYLKPKSLEPCISAVGLTKAETKAYTEQLVCLWGIEEREKALKVMKVDELELEKNYGFELQFPFCENIDFEESVEILPKKKKKL